MHSTPSLHKPFIVADPLLLNQVGELRIIAWKAEGELPYFAPRTGVWLDDHDSHGTIWAVQDGNTLIASARLCIHTAVRDLPDPECFNGFEDSIQLPVASLTRLVVHPDYRRQGLAALLDSTRLTYAESAGCKSVVSATHVQSRIKQLLTSGFKNSGIANDATVADQTTFVFIKYFS
jgi:GNAT superfamily N-acetyltransferase